MATLKQSPQNAGTTAITAYLNYLALERNVSASTQNQALNAMVFLTRHVFGQTDFTIEKPAHGHAYRRPPVVLSRREITAILAHANVSTTMIYLHVIKRPGAGAPSPLDLP